MEIREVLKHGTLSMGFIGLAECLTVLTGKHHGQAASAQELGLAIIGHMRKRMDQSSQQYRLNFTLLGTPAEGTAGRFVKLDKEVFGEIPASPTGNTTPTPFTFPFTTPPRPTKKSPSKPLIMS